MNGGAANRVEVDPVQLDREADAILQSIPAPEPAPGAAAAPDTAVAAAPGEAEWIQISPGIVAAIDILLIPQWGVTEPEKEALSKALADVLEAAFPGGLGDERYAPYIRLSLVSFGIAMARRDPKTGKLPPFGPKREAPPAPPVP